MKKQLSDAIVIEGQILIDSPIILHGANIYIKIEDTSRADAPSRTISEQILNKVHINSNIDQTFIPFKINLLTHTIDINLLTLSIHIDVNENGKIDKGDYINMESYPLFEQKRVDKLLVKVKQVR